MLEPGCLPASTQPAVRHPQAQDPKSLARLWPSQPHSVLMPQAAPPAPHNRSWHSASSLENALSSGCHAVLRSCLDEPWCHARHVVKYHPRIRISSLISSLDFFTQGNHCTFVGWASCQPCCAKPAWGVHIHAGHLAARGQRLAALSSVELLGEALQLGIDAEQAGLHLLHLPHMALGHAALVVAQDGHLRRRLGAGAAWELCQGCAGVASYEVTPVPAWQGALVTAQDRARGKEGCSWRLMAWTAPLSCAVASTLLRSLHGQAGPAPVGSVGLSKVSPPPCWRGRSRPSSRPGSHSRLQPSTAARPERWRRCRFETPAAQGLGYQD